MKPSLNTRRSALIEPLEARVAPALLVFGANLLGGSGNPTTGESSTGDTAITRIKVTSGQAIVWYDGSDITGVSFGPNAALEIFGDVEGDIVGNLTAAGRLSDSDNNPLNGEDGNVLLNNNLSKLTTAPIGPEPGSVGNIVTGGIVSNVKINGHLNGIFVGDGAFHPDSHLLDTGVAETSVTGSADVNPIQPGIQNGFDFLRTNAQMQPGASVKNINIAKAEAMQIIAGSGNPTNIVLLGAGPAGGSIDNVKIVAAIVPVGLPLSTPSYELIAGDGANGGTGGAGGSINKIIETASSSTVRYSAGDGGVGASGAGGKGGSVRDIDLQSNSTTYLISAGNGGAGTPGGAGGSSERSNYANTNTNSGVVLSANFDGDGSNLADVLVVDGSTGRITVAAQQPDGTFELITQFRDPNTNAAIKIVDSQGTQPVDGVTLDFDEDGDTDIIIAYKGTQQLVALRNNGSGSFYLDPFGPQPTADAIPVVSAGNPNALDVDPENPSRIVAGGILLDDSGKEVGILEQFSLRLDPDSGEYAFQKVGLETKTTIEVKDIAIGRTGSGFNGVAYMQKDGSLSRAFIVQQGNEPVAAFSGLTSFANIIGGATQMDISPDGAQLAVVGTTFGDINLFDTSLETPTLLGTLQKPNFGKATQLHYTDDENPGTTDGLMVLSNIGAASQISFYSNVSAGAAASREYRSNDAIRNFATVGDDNTPGFAGITGALNYFRFSSDFTTTSVESIPFSGKTVTITAGNGGTGVDLGNKLGAGGAGGSITTLNAEAIQIIVTAGAGGDSGRGPAGHGGTISTVASFKSASGTPITSKLIANDSISLTAGAGGSPTADGPAASGGNGGTLSGLNIELTSGNLTLAGGNGGISRGGNGGTGGSLSGITSLAFDGSLNATAGNGGSIFGINGKGGVGGSVLNLNHKLSLPEDVEESSSAYSVTVAAGHGGDGSLTLGGGGGAGGQIKGLTLDLDNSYVDYENFGSGGRDGITNPVTITLTSGTGGDGISGGAGGNISDIAYRSHHDQLTKEGFVIIGYFTMGITAGNGGNGTTGPGGAGGSFIGGKYFSGLTNFDPDAPTPVDNPTRNPLIITAGNGGNGAKGGIGGSISKALTKNSLFATGGKITGNHLDGALLTAGNGGDGTAGDGGAGGSIKDTSIGASGIELIAIAGKGGNGSAKGGAGGAITGGQYGFVRGSSSLPLTYLLAAGNGGIGGTLGGNGGAVGKIEINIQQDGFFSAGESRIIAGDGGAANGAGGKGGNGGSVSGLKQLKDINSFVSSINAGNGGDALQGTGGTGGSATSIKLAGTIGRASDFTARYGIQNPLGFAQGLFVGRGGDGITDGIAGSATSITARQIAAIAAISATPDRFVAATKVSSIKADLIGYDLDADGIFDGAGSPSSGTPIDGFILAKAISAVTTLGPARPGFIFNA